MASQAQLEANRRNAQKSTGPKTPEGRAAVRLNGLRHGLASGILVLEGESEADFENLLDSLAAEHQPATPTEVLLVRQMAMAGWRLQRIVHMEAAHYRLRRSDLEDYFEKHYTDLAEPDRLAIIADRDDHTLINFSRYEARLERSFHKALTALERLRAQRNSKMTNQSQFPQRAETASTSAAATPRAHLVQPNKLRLEPASPVKRPPNQIHSPIPTAPPPSPS
jgi:hypothetical protein